MHDVEESQRVKEFVEAAVVASTIEAPLDPGLTFLELVELGGPLSLKKGQIDRHLPALYANSIQPGPAGRLLPASMQALMLCGGFGWVYEPDPINRHCLAFVHDTLRAIADELGDRYAQMDRRILATRGEAAGLRVQDTDAAITLMILAEALIEKDGVVRYQPGKEWIGTPPVDRSPLQTRRPSMVMDLLGPVRDIIARRTDGRPTTTDPLRAFEERLKSLGHAKFETWWRQTVIELQRTDPQLAPVSAVVLSAALCEASLIFVTDRARRLGNSMNFRDAERSPRHWKMDQLAGAARSGADPVLTPQAGDRCLELNRIRQRVHVGRLIDPDENPPRPDTNPQEAREARATADLVIGQVLMWVDRNPETR